MTRQISESGIQSPRTIPSRSIIESAENENDESKEASVSGKESGSEITEIESMEDDEQDLTELYEMCGELKDKFRKLKAKVENLHTQHLQEVITHQAFKTKTDGILVKI